MTLEYENQRHFQSALMRSDRNQFVQSNGGGGNGTMTNGEEAPAAADTTSHMNGNAGSSSFGAPRMPIIFMLGEADKHYCGDTGFVCYSSQVHCTQIFVSENILS